MHTNTKIYLELNRWKAEGSSRGWIKTFLKNTVTVCSINAYIHPEAKRILIMVESSKMYTKLATCESVDNISTVLKGFVKYVNLYFRPILPKSWKHNIPVRACKRKSDLFGTQSNFDQFQFQFLTILLTFQWYLRTKLVFQNVPASFGLRIYF